MDVEPEGVFVCDGGPGLIKEEEEGLLALVRKERGAARFGGVVGRGWDMRES